MENNSQQKSINDSVIGFDQEENKYIYIYMASERSKLIKIVYGPSLQNMDDNACISPYLRNIVLNDSSVLNDENGICLDMKTDDKTFELVTNYINTYALEDEYPEPEVPITSEKLDTWMRNDKESTLFGKYRNMNDESKKDEYKILTSELIDLVNYSNYLMMGTLTKKIAALIANAVKEKDPAYIKSLFEIREFIPFTEPVLAIK